MNKSYIKTKSVRRRGEPGAKRLTKIYGDDLVCVRYKYDYKDKKRYKTVELLVETIPWQPPENDPYLNKEIHVKISYREEVLREQLKRYGARWNPAKKVWRTTLGTALALKLEDRIVF